MKFCKDCAHFVQPTGLLAAAPGAPFCGAEQAKKPVDIVYGTRRMSSCRDMRGDGQWCGKDAVWFAQKSDVARSWWRRMVSA